MPRFDPEMLSRYEEIPAAERRPGGPTHRLKPIAAPPIHLPRFPGKPKQATGPNTTELEARAILRLPEESAAFEGQTFAICGGATYTPDWVCGMTCVEAKGEHIHSRDSRRRFDEAKHLYPQFTWIWARKRTKGMKGPRWEIEVYDASRFTNVSVTRSGTPSHPAAGCVHLWTHRPIHGGIRRSCIFCTRMEDVKHGDATDEVTVVRDGHNNVLSVSGERKETDDKR